MRKVDIGLLLFFGFGLKGPTHCFLGILPELVSLCHFGRKRPQLKFPGESSARASVCWPSDRLSSEGIFRRRAFALIYGHGQRSDVKIQVLCHFMSTFERPSFQVKPE